MREEGRTRNKKQYLQSKGEHNKEYCKKEYLIIFQCFKNKIIYYLLFIIYYLLLLYG